MVAGTVILAAPPVPPPAPVSPWVSLKHEWIGHDGSVWTISDWREGVFLLMEELEGLHYPRVEKFTSSARTVPGHRVRGSRAVARDVFWPLFVWNDQSSVEWLAVNDAFFNSIHPELEGTWRVTSPVSRRELRLTGAFNSPHAYRTDPVSRGWEQYGVAFEAARPFWTGEPIARSWAASGGQDFIPEEGGPSFFVSSSRTFESASISNPGDVDAWPVWTITGPLDNVEVGIGGRVIELPDPISEGEVLVIDTDPRQLSVLLDGVDYSEELGFQRFASVPAKGTTALEVSATGSGSVSVSLTPLYFRAF